MLARPEPVTGIGVGFRRRSMGRPKVPARSEATLWLERGLASVEALPASKLLLPLQLRQFHGLWPSVAAIARLWGEFDPSRASGAIAAVPNPLLRAVGRAAAMEFADWPLPDVAAALLRAEREYLAGPLRLALDVRVRGEVMDAIALAWQRHDPSALPAVHARLNLAQGLALGLWRDHVATLAERTKLWPADHLLTAGPAEVVAFETRFGLTSSRRLRACLTMAVRIRQTEPPWR